MDGWEDGRLVDGKILVGHVYGWKEVWGSGWVGECWLDRRMARRGLNGRIDSGCTQRWGMGGCGGVRLHR